MKLTKPQKSAIETAINNLFTSLSQRLTGKYYKGGKIFFGILDPKTTLHGLYDYTKHTITPGKSTDTDHVKDLMDVTHNYIEAQKLKTLNRFIDAAKKADTKKELASALKKELDQTTKYIDMLVTTEARHVQVAAERETIAQMGADAGVEDPTVAVLGKMDLKTCNHCAKMFHRPDRPNTPILYKLSEMKMGYFKPKEWDGQTPYQPPLHPRCYDDETEVLTKRGWILFKEVLPEDVFLSVNPKTGDADWVAHRGLLKLRHKGEMDFFKSHRVDLMTTPNHNHVVMSKTEGNIFDIKPGNKLFKNDRLVCSIPNWKGTNSRVTFDNKEYDLKLFSEFMGYWLSEGYVQPGSKDTFRIEIAQQKHPIPMITVCEKIFGKKPYYKHGKIIVWCKTSENKELHSFLKSFGKSWEKYVPEIIKNSNKEVIKIFLDAYCLGDGSVRPPRGLGTLHTRCFRTSSSGMAADIGELILKIGRKPSYLKSKTRTIKHLNGIYTTKHPCWTVSDNKILTSNLECTSKTKVDYDGYVYDVELEKWHTLFVRRNGKVLLSGNCRHVMVYVPKGYGYDSAGRLKFIDIRHDAYEEQNKEFNKTEWAQKNLEDLKKSADDCECEEFGDL